MPSANTQPAIITDKNGHNKTVHKRVDPKMKGAARTTKLAAPATSTKSVEDFGSATSERQIHHSFNDDIFDGALISRNDAGKLTATGSFTIDSDSMEYLSDEVGDLYKYLETHSDEIKGIIAAEYGASSVTVHPLEEEIVVNYEVPIDDNISNEELIDALYETRAVTLHSHANTSDKFSYAISGLDNVEEESFVPRSPTYAFDDEH